MHLIESTKGYGLPTLAMWPQPCPRAGCWEMAVCKLTEDMHTQWVTYNTPTGVGYRPELYDCLSTAIEVARKRNQLLINNIYNFDFPDEVKASIRLKAEKAVTAKKRLVKEEYVMLQEAINGARNQKRPVMDELQLPEGLGSEIRSSLYQQLQETPYIRLARISGGLALAREGEHQWTRVLTLTKKVALDCYREKIARGFGLSLNRDWREVKAEIRTMLLPRANKLLQLASVKRMLDAALAEGKKVLVSGSYVFWFEESGDLGWSVKLAQGRDGTQRGATLWEEGTIVSKNHGRLIILPYITEKGIKRRGHTKNAPHDGEAIERHPDDYVELPFEVLDDDLMIGLFGELRYE